MGLVNKLWNVCTSVVDAGVNYATSILSGVGSLSAMAGGAGLAFAYVADEQLNANYYGTAHTPGELLVGINIPALNFNISEVIPFQHVLTKEGQVSYNSQSYLTPQFVSIISGALVVGGTLLKVASANLKKWSDYRDDKKSLKEAHNIDYLASPSRAEYGYSSAEAALLAVSQASLSGAVVGGVLSFSSLNDFKESFTYPSSGEKSTEGQYYKGPVATSLIPVELDLKQNVTVDVPIVNIKLLIEQTAKAKAVANVTYGGGLFFKANNDNHFPVVVPAIIAVGAHQFSRFFKSKAIKARDDRIVEAREQRYGILG